MLGFLAEIVQKIGIDELQDELVEAIQKANDRKTAQARED